ncbi:MAG: tyrosine-type recombinase/integrase [Thermoanaerobaculia bacterium]
MIVPGTNAMRRRKKTIFVEKRDKAHELWAEFREEVLRGGSPKPKVVTFGDYVSRHLSDYLHRVSPATATSYGQMVRNHLLPFFGLRRLDEISMASVRDFVGHLKRYRSKARSRFGRTLSPATINDCLAVLRVLVRDAHERGVIEKLPWRGRWPFEKAEAPRLELIPEEQRRFLVAFDDELAFREHVERSRSNGRVVSSSRFGGFPRSFGGGRRPEGEAVGAHFSRFRSLKPLFVVALETGLRRSDLLSLRWRSVDLENGWIRITMRKTKREAVIPISAACREAFAELHERPVLAEFVFVRDDGRTQSWTTVKKTFELAKTLAGITRRFRFHDLRHTFGCRLASGGVSIQVIAKAMGHCSVQMTERYARPSEESLTEIRRALDAQKVKTPPGVNQGASESAS